MSSESEISLIIYSNNIQNVVDKIKSIGNIDGFRIKYVEDVTIVDTYFDNDIGLLHKKKDTLRIRNKNANILVTLKGPPKYQVHSISRQEYEYDWSKGSFTKISEHLKDLLGIDIKNMDVYFDDDPIKTFDQIGFKEIHKHTNNRKIFDITRVNDLKNSIVSEMDVDNVTFHFKSNNDSLNVSVINIEIEKKSKTNEDQTIAKNITKYLKQEFGSDSVIEWRYGKLLLGKGIGELYKINELKNYIGFDGYIKNNILDKIKDYIQKGII